MSGIFASGSNHSITHSHAVACSSLDELNQEGKQSIGVLCGFTFYVAVKFYYLNSISNTEQENSYWAGYTSKKKWRYLFHMKNKILNCHIFLYPRNKQEVKLLIAL